MGMTASSRKGTDFQATLRSLPYGARVSIVVGAGALGLAIAALAPPEHQLQAYHDFAPSGPGDLGIVLSNLAFLVVGLWGLRLLYGGSLGRTLFAVPSERRPFVAFFAGAVLVTFGSGYYHLDPNDDTLVWDRLAMTVIFMGLFAAFIADRVHRRAGITVMLPTLLALGAISIAYWDATGDLRAYRLVQLLPIALITLICLLFPGRLTRFKFAAWMAFWYALATLFEFFDRAVYTVLSIGGHTIKHLLAAIACYIVLVMLRDAARSGRSQREGTGR
jgi:hypothetical protein